MGSDVDILPQLLLPLAGPEELLENEMDQLPIDLQYLPEEKEREPDPEIRLMLVETLLQVGFLTFSKDRDIAENTMNFIDSILGFHNQFLFSSIMYWLASFLIQ